MMGLLRLVCLYACVGLALTESRFRQSSLSADAVSLQLHTSNKDNWDRFWLHMKTQHAGLGLNFEERKFHGAGRSGAAFYVPSVDTEKPGKIVKVLVDEKSNNPRLRPVDDRKKQLEAEELSQAFVSFEERSEWGSFVHHFVKRQVYHSKIVHGVQAYHFEVMDYVEGMTLKEYIASGARHKTPEHLRHLVRQLLEVLYVLSQVRFIHADLHTDNIMIRPDGHLVVIDMDGSLPCQKVDTSFAKSLFIPYDSFPWNRKQEGTFTSVDEETCIAFDAYSVGMDIVLLTTMSPMSAATSAPFYFRNAVVASLQKLDPTLQHLTSNVLEDTLPYPPVLERILSVLLEVHRAPRTAGTFAILDQILLKELQSGKDEKLVFAVTDSIPDPTRNPENLAGETSERERQSASPVATNVALRGSYEETMWGSESHDSTPKPEIPSATDEKYDIFDLGGRTPAENGLTEYMQDMDVSAFPPGGPIVSRRDTLKSYNPNILLRKGLLATPLGASKRSVEGAVRYNILQLQLVYRQKLVLQVVPAEACKLPKAEGWASESPVLLAIDEQVATGADTAKTVFAFVGQSLEEVLRLVEHPVEGKSVHASLMSWDNHVIVGGCLQKGGSESGQARYQFREESEVSSYFFTVDKPGLSLQLHAPQVLVVGGGPMGLVSALEARRSAATVTVWEKRSGYSRMYCQACSVSSVVERFHLTTEQYLKSVEETLAAVAVTVGVNLQFTREFLYVDQAVAVGKESGRKWMARPGTPWAALKIAVEEKNVSPIRLRINVLIAADGSSSTIRKHFLGSGFADAEEVVLKGTPKQVSEKQTSETHDSETHDSETHDSETQNSETQGSETHGSETHGSETLGTEAHDSETHDSEKAHYNTRVLRRSDGKPIYSLATLQFLKHRCTYTSSSCVRHDTGFDMMWDIRRKYQDICFIEYIENDVGLKYVEEEILAKNGLSPFSADGVDAWETIRQHGRKHRETAGERAATKTFDELMLARYLSTVPGLQRPLTLRDVAVRDNHGQRCALLETPSAKMLSAFTDLRDPSLFSTFWIRTRRADRDRFAVVKEGVVAVLVGDASRDSFFPFGSGLRYHISVATNPIDFQGLTSPTKASVIGALLRQEIDVDLYNAYFEKHIQAYIDRSSLALLTQTACKGGFSLESASKIRQQNVAKVRTRTSQQVEALCPTLSVVDT